MVGTRTRTCRRFNRTVFRRIRALVVHGYAVSIGLSFVDWSYKDLKLASFQDDTIIKQSHVSVLPDKPSSWSAAASVYCRLFRRFASCAADELSLWSCESSLMPSTLNTRLNSPSIRLKTPAGMPNVGLKTMPTLRIVILLTPAF